MNLLELTLAAFKFFLALTGIGFVLAVVIIVTFAICLIPLAIRAKTNALEALNYKLAIDNVGSYAGNVIWYSLWTFIAAIASGLCYIIVWAFS